MYGTGVAVSDEYLNSLIGYGTRGEFSDLRANGR